MNTDKLKSKIIVILGQTATGKSDFAVDVAKEVNGEIISADSRQVYKGMNLGTGKITKKEMKKIPHYLLDVISPSRVFTVNNYKKLVDKKIKEIISRKKIPIICGGTGFYIDTVINNTIFPDVPPNKKLRKELYQLDAIALTRYLEKLDPERAKTIDKNNKVRLVRAIEIAKSLGSVPPLYNLINQNTTNSAMAGFVVSSKFEIIKIGLTLPNEILKERIHTRLLARIKLGMIKEIKDLHDNKKISWKRMENLGLEYRYVALFLQEKISRDEMIEQLNTQIWHYAKRQKTWFKRDKSIFWINPLEIHQKTKAIKKVKEFLK